MFEFQLSNAFVSVARMRARVGAPLIPSLSLSLYLSLSLSPSSQRKSGVSVAVL